MSKQYSTTIDTTNKYPAQQFDVLIIGSGLAGMSLALRLAETQKVALLTKGELFDAASAWAQGGRHGANRLASNSLLECLVFSEAVERDIAAQTSHEFEVLPDWDESRVTNTDEEVIISHNWDELRRFMWDYVGIVRTDKRLDRAMHRIELLKSEINDYYANFRVTNDLLELRNLVQTAELIVRSAMARKESRGLHYSLDYPALLTIAKDTILTPQ